VEEIKMDEKRQAQKQWNTTPCGTGDHLNDVQLQTLEYYEKIREYRYSSNKWIKKTIDFNTYKGKRVLEIGHGIGTDLLLFAENGASVYGIDITESHHEMAKENFRLHNLDAQLKLCDASDIQFPANFFDVVYSLGVLHHTPDTIRCIGEAYRVLKPGGVFILSLYYKYSIFHLWNKLFVDGLLRGGLRKLGYQGLMSTVESGADGINIKPLVKTFSKGQLRSMLSDFSTVRFKISHFDKKTQAPIVHRCIPGIMEPILAKFAGWYVTAFCKKQA
jgi:2-polyprenyl-3-methyl-5-hydroxy-6-metoxy-1,4-benzoquinol methylase